VKRGGETLFQNIQPAFLDLSANLARMLEGVEDCRFIIDSKRIRVNGDKFSEKSKKHEFYGAIGSAVGSIGGGVVGAKIGAAIGSVIPGAGTFIGFAIGALLGGLLLGSGGAELRRIELERQKETARSELFEATEKFCKSAKQKFEDALSGFCDETDRAIRNWLKEQKKMVEEHFAKAYASLLKPVEEKSQLTESAKNDIVVMNDWIKKLGDE
jgi:gas vesicle protein